MKSLVAIAISGLLVGFSSLPSPPTGPDRNQCYRDCQSCRERCNHQSYSDPKACKSTCIEIKRYCCEAGNNKPGNTQNCICG